MTVQNCTSVGTGDWDDGSTWSTGSAPQAAEHVIIANGHDVTIDTSSAVRSLTVQDGGKLIGNSSYTIRITHEGTASFGTNTFAVSFAADGGNGGSELGANVNLDVETSDSTMLRIQPVTGNLHNFEISHPNVLAYLTQNTTLAGNLTIGSGRLDTDSSGNYSLTVTGACEVTGTLTCNASAVTLGSLDVVSGATFSAPSDSGSGLLTIGNATQSAHAGTRGFAVDMNGGTTFTHNSGTIRFTGTQNISPAYRGAATYNNVTFAQSGSITYMDTETGDNWIIAGTLTINAGATLTNQGYDDRINCTGACSIAGTLNLNHASGGDHSFGSMTIASGGEYSATSGTTTINGGGSCLDFTAGTLTHNNGLFKISGGNGTNIKTTGATANDNLYDLEIDSSESSAASTAWLGDGTVIEGNLTLTEGKFYPNTSSQDFIVKGNTSIKADATFGNMGGTQATGDYTFGGVVTN